MPLCREKDDGVYMVWLLYTSVGIGAFLCGVMNVIFAYKWRQFEPEFRSLLMPRLSAIVVTSITIVRVLRLVQIWFWYHLSREVANISFITEGVVTYLFVYGMLMVFMIVKLDASFKGSVYAVHSKHIRILYSLIFMAVILQILIHVIDSSSLSNTPLGQLTVVIGALLALIFNVAVLAKLNYSFASRLRTLVAMSSVSAAGGSLGRSGSASPYSSTDTGKSKLTLSRKPSLAEMKHSSVNAFGESSSKRLLRTAAKSLTLAVWISVAFLVYTIVVVFHVNGECADWSMLTAQILAIFPNLSVSAVLLLTLPHSEKEYSQICTPCDNCLQTVVAWQTTRQVVELTRQRTHSQNSRTHD